MKLSEDISEKNPWKNPLWRLHETNISTKQKKKT